MYGAAELHMLTDTSEVGGCLGGCKLHPLECLCVGGLRVIGLLVMIGPVGPAGLMVRTRKSVNTNTTHARTHTNHTRALARTPSDE